MMKRGNGTDVIEMRFRKVPDHCVSQLKFEIIKMARSGACDANHLRRQIERGYSAATFRQKSCECAGAAADLETAFTIRRNVFEQEIVIMVVRGPTFIVEEGQTIKICFYRRHYSV